MGIKRGGKDLANFNSRNQYKKPKKNSKYEHGSALPTYNKNSSCGLRHQD
jgi:hypothetical protein